MAETKGVVQSEHRNRRARLAVLVAAVLALLFTAGIFLAPALDTAGSGWGKVLRFVYAPACHQLPERCLTVGGLPQAVCARCAGLYLGGVAGLAVGALLLAGTGRCPRSLWLAVALAPTAVDALLPWLSLPQLPGLPRLVLAVPGGAVAGLFLAVGIADLFTFESKARPPGPLVHNASPVLEEVDG
jgi:uncharacterized membrane protein